MPNRNNFPGSKNTTRTKTTFQNPKRKKKNKGGQKRPSQQHLLHAFKAAEKAQNTEETPPPEVTAIAIQAIATRLAAPRNS